MSVSIRIIGGIFVLLGSINLVALWFTDLAYLISPPLVILRYTLMVISGIGFLLLRRWGLFVYATSFAINWIALFAVYEGKASGPLWLSLPIPVAVFVLCYFAWDRLKPGIRSKPAGK